MEDIACVTDAVSTFEDGLSASLRDLQRLVPDDHRTVPAEALARLRDAGLFEATLPRDAGGLGLCEPSAAARLRRVLVAVGRASQVIGRLYEGHANAHALIFRYGGDAARAATIEDTRAGRLFGVWNTEPPADGVAMDASAATLSGRKTYASGAGFVTRPLITARNPDGLRQMMIAPLDEDERSDLGPWRARGMRASATGTVSFEGYPLARAVFVGEPDDYHREPFFSAGAWRFLAVHLGGIEAVHAAHKAHIRGLGRDGDPHQLARLGQSGVAVETARAFVERACFLANDGGGADPRSVVAYVNLARAAVERAGLDAIELAHRSVGLASMMEEHPLERMTRDLAVYLRQPGPDYALASAARRLFELDGCYLVPDER